MKGGRGRPRGLHRHLFPAPQSFTRAWRRTAPGCCSLCGHHPVWPPLPLAWMVAWPPHCSQPPSGSPAPTVYPQRTDFSPFHCTFVNGSPLFSGESPKAPEALGGQASATSPASSEAMQVPTPCCSHTGFPTGPGTCHTPPAKGFCIAQPLPCPQHLYLLLTCIASGLSLSRLPDDPGPGSSHKVGPRM